jgi:hypothetical protein
MADHLYYVYAVVPATIAIEAAPPGIDGHAVGLIADGDVAALAGRIDAALYGSGVDDRIADVSWLAPRATAHDAVLTWASDLGAVVPLPLLSLFRSEDAVRAMLTERRDELRGLLESLARGREYGVRIFRVDQELRRALSSFSPELAALEAEVSSAPSPGQAYLLSPLRSRVQPTTNSRRTRSRPHRTRCQSQIRIRRERLFSTRHSWSATAASMSFARR